MPSRALGVAVQLRLGMPRFVQHDVHTPRQLESCHEPKAFVPDGRLEADAVLTKLIDGSFDVVAPERDLVVGIGSRVNCKLPLGDIEYQPPIAGIDVGKSQFIFDESPRSLRCETRPLDTLRRYPTLLYGRLRPLVYLESMPGALRDVKPALAVQVHGCGPPEI